MNTPPMHWSRLELSLRIRRLRWRGLATLAFLAAAPKCALCLASWLGLGALLGLGGPEICGASAAATRAESIALIGGLMAAGAGGCALLRSRH